MNVIEPSKPAGKGPDGRRQGREIALQMLYQAEAASSHPSEVLRSFDIYLYRAEVAPAGKTEDAGEVSSRDEATAKQAQAPPSEPTRQPKRQLESDVERQITAALGERARSRAFSFAKELFLGVTEGRQDLDRRIQDHADNWRVERMSGVDRNILRLALHESGREDAVPPAVIIDEAIELAKKFGGEHSGAFVNGVLDGALTKG